MKSNINKFQKCEKIGEGTYGFVYKAMQIKSLNRNLESQEIVAIKKIKIDDDDDGIPQTALREIAILKRNQHQNIVQQRTFQKFLIILFQRLLDVHYDQESQNLYLIFEYMEYDLRKFLNLNKNLSIFQKKVKSYVQQSIIHQILQGVQYLHERRIFHRDLKPQNILVNKKGFCKIADFGLSRTIKFPQILMTHEIQTLWYRAPEVILGSDTYSLPVDIWSIGCIFSEIMHGIPLFQGNCEIDQIFKIFQYHGTPNDQTWQGIDSLPFMKQTFPQFEISLEYQNKRCPNFDILGQQLFSQLINIDPEQRITCVQALNHNYFAGFDFYHK